MYTIKFLIITILFEYYYLLVCYNWIFNHDNLFQASQSFSNITICLYVITEFSIITILLEYHNLLVCYNWIFNHCNLFQSLRSFSIITIFFIHYNLFRLSQSACVINGNLTRRFTQDFTVVMTLLILSIKDLVLLH